MPLFLEPGGAGAAVLGADEETAHARDVVDAGDRPAEKDARVHVRVRGGEFVEFRACFRVRERFDDIGGSRS